MARFSEVLTIINGKNQSKVENPNGRYPIYGSGGVMGYADSYLCKANTVIIGRKGSINNPIFVDTPFWNVDTAFGLEANADVLLPKYLYYFCKAFDFEKLNTTVTIPSLTKANLLSIDIPLPSLMEQKAIVAKLDKVDELISLRKKQLQNLDDLVKSRFVELFGDPAQNTMGLPVKTLPEISDNLDSRRIPITSSDRKAGVFPYYGASGIVDYVENYIFDEDILLVSEDGANLLARVTPIAFSVSGKVWVNNHAHVIRFTDKAMQIYVEHLLNMIDISSFVTGTAQPKLNQAKMNSIPIPMPMERSLQAFLEFVKQNEKTKLTVQQGLDKLELLKQSLMQKYFGQNSSVMLEQSNSSL